MERGTTIVLLPTYPVLVLLGQFSDLEISNEELFARKNSRVELFLLSECNRIAFAFGRQSYDESSGRHFLGVMIIKVGIPRDMSAFAAVSRNSAMIVRSAVLVRREKPLFLRNQPAVIVKVNFKARFVHWNFPEHAGENPRVKMKDRSRRLWLAVAAKGKDP